MTAEQESRLRVAIRAALEIGDWEQDIAFLIPTGNQADAYPPFDVLVTDDGVASVTVPTAWEHEPYIHQVLQHLASQELDAHLERSQPN